ncbi:hypothetical protein ISF_01634 [Cordyceps fumosorosea ARSEF 2679]|uniref:Glycoside hydrolase n=1 Tax=Cordyceps fumosorosea (strain ARSEF 2679) TaxID=1081104 RepID=A0A168DFT4_CORFA|nr:hypothetical protein ISF_01634 [Cordyceps fumosorosea ARSEF 2679]OAA72561.1 hypothetical protein ISF_01634 [Cordyceps fumosorosea ARSEF 2679]
MIAKTAISALLAGAAIAAPATPTATEVDFSIGALDSRQLGGKVNNGAIANFNADNTRDGIGAGKDEYKMYWGDGSTGAGWPDRNRWVSFEDMFNNYKPQMFSSCGNQGQANDSGPEVGRHKGAMYDGIQKAAKASGVDHRFILAVIMQESGGCVRVKTTNYGVRNPGLMQDHDGVATCNENGRVQNPCPSSTIYQMISEGSAGTAKGEGLAQTLNRSGRSDVSAFYRAARLYNSGSISHTGNLQDGIATHCYSSDIANRLTGWVNAVSKCNCDNDPNSCGITTN